MYLSFISFCWISHPNQIVSNCKPFVLKYYPSITSIMCGFEELIYWAQTVWGSKIKEVKENLRPSGLAFFLKAHESLNHLEQMDI